MEKFILPSWSARNPLGIVALFISLIYGMSAFLLGHSVHALSPNNQTILVIFIVTFPFVVLGVFGWLVARHHMKLYGPADFRTDKSFLDAIGSLAPAEIGKRLQQEVIETEVASISNESPSVVSSAETSDANTETISLSPGVGKSISLKTAFLAETMVFQTLQTELKASVRRNVRLPNGGEVDGIIETTDGTIAVVEVKFIRNTTKNFADVFYAFGRQLRSIEGAFSREPQVVPKIILAVVFDGSPEQLPRIEKILEKYRSRYKNNAEIRLYSLSELLKDFGLTSDAL
jgi:hypothetical protein